MEAHAAAAELLAGARDSADVSLRGQDGFALARAARALHPGLRVILASGYAPATLDTDLASEAIAFLPKPYRTDDLLAAISGPP